MGAAMLTVAKLLATVIKTAAMILFMLKLLWGSIGIHVLQRVLSVAMKTIINAET